MHFVNVKLLVFLYNKYFFCFNIKYITLGSLFFLLNIYNKLLVFLRIILILNLFLILFFYFKNIRILFI